MSSTVTDSSPNRRRNFYHVIVSRPLALQPINWLDLYHPHPYINWHREDSGLWEFVSTFPRRYRYDNWQCQKPIGRSSTEHLSPTQWEEQQARKWNLQHQRRRDDFEARESLARERHLADVRAEADRRHKLQKSQPATSDDAPRAKRDAGHSEAHTQDRLGQQETRRQTEHEREQRVRQQEREREQQRVRQQEREREQQRVRQIQRDRQQEEQKHEQERIRKAQRERHEELEQQQERERQQERIRQEQREYQQELERQEERQKLEARRNSQGEHEQFDDSHATKHRILRKPSSYTENELRRLDIKPFELYMLSDDNPNLIATIRVPGFSSCDIFIRTPSTKAKQGYMVIIKGFKFTQLDGRDYVNEFTRQFILPGRFDRRSLQGSIDYKGFLTIEGKRLEQTNYDADDEDLIEFLDEDSVEDDTDINNAHAENDSTYYTDYYDDDVTIESLYI